MRARDVRSLLRQRYYDIPTRIRAEFSAAAIVFDGRLSYQECRPPEGEFELMRYRIANSLTTGKPLVNGGGAFSSRACNRYDLLSLAPCRLRASGWLLALLTSASATALFDHRRSRSS